MILKVVFSHSLPPFALILAALGRVLRLFILPVPLGDVGDEISVTEALIETNNAELRR